ncbi:hypothetical protein MXD62_21955 [Frankia sp. Mgl5]|nr:hypothetical protein [Frankia sp. Mgl5]
MGQPRAPGEYLRLSVSTDKFGSYGYKEMKIVQNVIDRPLMTRSRWFKKPLIATMIGGALVVGGLTVAAETTGTPSPSPSGTVISNVNEQAHQLGNPNAKGPVRGSGNGCTKVPGQGGNPC